MRGQTSCRRGSRSLSDGQIRQSRFWWISVIRGIISLLLGTAVLVTQGNRVLLGNFIGAYWMLSGLLTFRWALTVRWLRGSRIGLAAGILSVMAGLLVLLREQLRELIAPNTLINILGAAAVLTGFLRLLSRSCSPHGGWSVGACS